MSKPDPTPLLIGILCKIVEPLGAERLIRRKVHRALAISVIAPDRLLLNVLGNGISSHEAMCFMIAENEARIGASVVS